MIVISLAFIRKFSAHATTACVIILS